MTSLFLENAPPPSKLRTILPTWPMIAVSCIVARVSCCDFSGGWMPGITHKTLTFMIISGLFSGVNALPFDIQSSNLSLQSDTDTTDTIFSKGDTPEICASSELPEYNVPLHVIGIFIVLLISGTGIFTTMSLGVRAKTPVFAKVLQILKMFGIGVIAATAWIHLLPDAFVAFNSPCLPEAWKPYGPAYVGLFGMIAAFLVQFIKLAAVDIKRNYFKKHDHSHSDTEHNHSEYDTDEHTLLTPVSTSNETGSVHAYPDAVSSTQYAQQSVLGAVEDADCDCTDLERVVVTGNSAAFLPTSSSAATFGDTESLNGSIDDCECTDLDRVVVTGNSAAFLSSARNSIVANLSKEASSGLPSSERNRVSQGIRVIPPASIPKPPGPPGHTQLPLIQESPAAALPYTATGSQDLMSFFDAVPSAHSGRTPGTDHNSEHDHHDENERDNELGTILLECGILFHSLIIGVTLGVSSDVAFRSLIVAVCFHQMFEGLALGVLIGNLNLSVMTKRLMCLVYPFTTPIGIFIGILVRDLYNENDGGVVLAQGVFNSLSAGILFYNTYTELMSAEVSHSGHFHGFSPYFKAACFVAMYSGAALMALLAVFE